MDWTQIIVAAAKAHPLGQWQNMTDQERAAWCCFEACKQIDSGNVKGDPRAIIRAVLHAAKINGR